MDGAGDELTALWIVLSLLDLSLLLTLLLFACDSCGTSEMACANRRSPAMNQTSMQLL